MNSRDHHHGKLRLLPANLFHQRNAVPVLDHDFGQNQVKGILFQHSDRFAAAGGQSAPDSPGAPGWRRSSTGRALRHPRPGFAPASVPSCAFSQARARVPPRAALRRRIVLPVLQGLIPRPDPPILPASQTTPQGRALIERPRSCRRILRVHRGRECRQLCLIGNSGISCNRRESAPKRFEPSRKETTMPTTC